MLMREVSGVVQQGPMWSWPFLTSRVIRLRASSSACPLSQDFGIVHDRHDLAVEVELECGVLVQDVEQVVHQLNQLHLEALLDFVPFKIPMGVGEDMDVEDIFGRRRRRARSTLFLSRHGRYAPFVVMFIL